MGIQKIFRTNFQVEGNYLFNKNIFCSYIGISFTFFASIVDIRYIHNVGKEIST